MVSRTVEGSTPRSLNTNIPGSRRALQIISANGRLEMNIILGRFSEVSSEMCVADDFLTTLHIFAVENAFLSQNKKSFP